MLLRFTPSSRRDLKSISRYTLAEFGQAQEQRYIAELRRHIEGLLEFPRSGREYIVGGSLRISTYREHHVLYRQEGGVLRIEGVVHQAQDLETVLQRRRLTSGQGPR